MSEIYVKKINETELVVDGDRGALQEMSEYFSFLSSLQNTALNLEITFGMDVFV